MKQNSRSFWMLSVCLLTIVLLKFCNESVRPFYSNSFGRSTTVEKALPPPLKRQPFVLLAEPRCYAATPFVLKNALDKLPESVRVILFHSQQNHYCVSQWLNGSSALQAAQGVGRLVLKQDERVWESGLDGEARFSTSNWISSLYVNSSWWSELRSYGDTVLTMESDSLICSKNHSSNLWQDFHYLGGISNRHKRVAASSKDELNQYHLDGGFSVRHLDWLIKCLEHYAGPNFLQEDTVFNSCPKGSAIITTVDAMRFASYNGHTMCFDSEGERICPYGVHRPWVLGKRFQESYEELVRYCPDVSKLRELQHTDPFVLITEPRCHQATPFVLENALVSLPATFKIVMFHAPFNEHCVKAWIAESALISKAVETGRLVLRKDNRMDPNIENKKYNADSWNTLLLVNKTWWEDLRQYGDIVLTMQTDTVICNKNHSVVPWSTVNFIGGVSHTNNQVPPSDERNTHHLNGGFSLRRIDWIISCLDNYHREIQVEDTLFNVCPYGQKEVKVVEAMKFASDNGHSLCFDWDGQRVCPYGVHKPWVIGQNFEEEYAELERYCPDIRGLAARQRTYPFALLVEPRCFAATPFVLTNALAMLPKTSKVVFVYTKQNEGCVQRWKTEGAALKEAAEDGRLVMRRMDVDEHPNNTSSMTRNATGNFHDVMFANNAFWVEMGQYGGTVLTLQSDSIICSKDQTWLPWDIGDFLGGMPVFDGNMTTNTYMNKMLLDGAFSIRQINWMIDCLQSDGDSGMPGANLLSVCLEQRPAFNSYDSAALVSDRGRTFCFDRDGQRVCPYGARRPWDFGEQNVEAYQELVKYCPEIESLRRLQHSDHRR